MKPLPTNPEFVKFTEAMRAILKVSKVELQRRIEADKQTPKRIASRAARAVVASRKRAG
jgi:hypothetical protein